MLLLPMIDTVAVLKCCCAALGSGAAGAAVLQCSSSAVLLRFWFAFVVFFWRTSPAGPVTLLHWLSPRYTLEVTQRPLRLPEYEMQRHQALCRLFSTLTLAAGVRVSSLWHVGRPWWYHSDVMNGRAPEANSRGLEFHIYIYICI